MSQSHFSYFYTRTSGYEKRKLRSLRNTAPAWPLDDERPWRHAAGCLFHAARGRGRKVLREEPVGQIKARPERLRGEFALSLVAHFRSRSGWATWLLTEWRSGAPPTASTTGSSSVSPWREDGRAFPFPRGGWWGAAALVGGGPFQCQPSFDTVNERMLLNEIRRY